GEEANVSDQRKLDLGGCITFAQKQLAVGAVGHVAISGSTASLPAWKDAFGRELGLQVGIQETAGMLGIKSGDWGGYSAIGASLRFRFSSAVTLDLGEVGRVTEEERVVARDILLASGVLSLGLLLIGLWSLSLYGIRAREFGSLKRDRMVEEVFRGKSPGDIEGMFAKMRTQSNLTMDLTSASRVKMIDVIKDIVDALPEKGFLKKIGIRFGLNVSPTLLLVGNVVAEDTAREQDLAFQFRNRLSTSSVAGQMFRGLKVTVQGQAVATPASGAQSSKAYSEALETRTSFTVAGTKEP
ncbi:MAG: hypothetical protein NTY77_00500, partial [Elusimicrobia bacterium]|nr:hypothetical protein [Elusimicrobiota bacterium]